MAGTKILKALSTATCMFNNASFVNTFSSLYIASSTWHPQHHRYQQKSHRAVFRQQQRQFISMTNSDAESLRLVDQSSSKGGENKKSKPQPAKVHTVTVCVVPPPENGHVWQALSEMRLELRDPGYYRWPPHVNLLYPFVELPDISSSSSSSSNSSDDDNGDVADGNSEIRSDDDYSTQQLQQIVEKLESATRTISPFVIRLEKLGTFGGKRRGVLWLQPDSVDARPHEENCRDDDDENNNHNNNESEEEQPSISLARLQKSLEEAFPMCQDQSQKGGGGFTPHMTLSHFQSLEEAIHAQKTTEASSPHVVGTSSSNNGTGDNHGACLEFLLDRVYLLERKGDGGQFLRVAEIALGADTTTSGDSSCAANSSGTSSSQTKIFDPPQPFPDMPKHEDQWVHTERMQLKSRRKNNRKSRRER